jgi:hypothetical protein
MEETVPVIFLIDKRNEIGRWAGELRRIKRIDPRDVVGQNAKNPPPANARPDSRNAD